MFEAFQQANATTSRKPGGTGLALSADLTGAAAAAYRRALQEDGADPELRALLS